MWSNLSQTEHDAKIGNKDADFKFKTVVLNKPSTADAEEVCSNGNWSCAMGDGAAEYFYNLYEYEDGTRECEKFDGGQYYTIPENADFSTKAQVKAWIYGGNVPRNILNIEPLIEEVNKNIKKHSVKMVMDDQDDEPMLKKNGSGDRESSSSRI